MSRAHFFTLSVASASFSGHWESFERRFRQVDTSGGPLDWWIRQQAGVQSTFEASQSNLRSKRNLSRLKTPGGSKPTEHKALWLNHDRGWSLSHPCQHLFFFIRRGLQTELVQIRASWLVDWGLAGRNYDASLTHEANRCSLISSASRQDIHPACSTGQLLRLRRTLRCRSIWCRSLWRRALRCRPLLLSIPAREVINHPIISQRSPPQLVNTETHGFVIKTSTHFKCSFLLRCKSSKFDCAKRNTK